MQSVIELVPPPQEAIPIDSMFSVLKQDDLRVIFAGGAPIMEYFIDDVAARDHVIVQLSLRGNITEENIARGLEVSRATVTRAKGKYEREGVKGLVPKKRGRKNPTKIKGSKEKLLRKLHKLGVPQVEIARRLGVTSAAIHKAIKRLGLKTAREQKRLELEESPSRAQATVDNATAIEVPVCEEPTAEEPTAEEPTAEEPTAEEPTAEEPTVEEPTVEEPNSVALPTATQSTNPAVAARQAASSGETNESSGHEAPRDVAAMDAEDGPGPQSEVPSEFVLPARKALDQDPRNRFADRAMARLGLLDDAAPLFGTQSRLRFAGLLLAVPILVTHGVVADAVKIFGGIGPAFYGIGTTVMSFLYMFLARINRPEQLKEHSPQELGAVMGLDRFPEMKTMRRKVRRLAFLKRGLSFLQKLAERHLSRLKSNHLWLYLDGHVSVYSGKRKLKKHHVTRLRISLPSVLDYWLNDDRGDPLFVVTGSQHKSMVRLIPKLVKQLRDQGETRPITIVFDREGWSPEMFSKLMEMPDVYLLSYRKAAPKKRLPRLPQTAFERYQGEVDGVELDYQLADQGIYLPYGPKGKRKRLHLRQITRLKDNGHQTHIVSNNWDEDTLVLAWKMFHRWGQENYFKYTGQEMSLDALWSYLMEDDDPERKVPNPDRKKLHQKIRRLEKKHQELQAQYGDRARNNDERQRQTTRGFKIANSELSAQIRQIEEEIAELEKHKAALPASVPVKDVLNGETPKQVHQETRRLLHGFRMAAFRAESALRELLRPHYRRWRHDGRTIVQSMLQTTGDIVVEGDVLRVILEPQSAPHRTRALKALCEELNRLAVMFPGSDLRLHYEVKESNFAS